MPNENVHLDGEVGYFVHKTDCSDFNYYMAVPMDLEDRCDIFVGLPKVDLANLSNEKIVSEIRLVTESLGMISKKGIFLVPDIAVSEIQEAADENDHRLYKNLFEKIQMMVKDACIKLGSNDNKFKISRYQAINLIRQSDEDAKFFGWLEIFMGNFIKVIKLPEIIKEPKEQIETFVDNKMIFKDIPDINSKETYNNDLNN